MRKSGDTDSDVNRLAAANNDLGFRLLSGLIAKDADQNIFISSFSVAIALAMIYNGAEDKTKEVMAATLGLTGLSLQQINEANAAFTSMQQSLDPKVQLAIANSIWVRQGIEPSAEFIHRLATYYAGQVTSLNFGDSGAADTINRWVAGKTHHKITQLVSADVVRPAIMLLINAIYFKGIWTTQFDPDRTRERAFILPDGSRKQHPVMFQSGHYDYYETQHFQAVSLPYGEGRISMYIFLPKPATSLREFQKDLTLDNWRNWMRRFRKKEGDIGLPRFKMEYGIDLLPILTAMGSREFAGEDFRGMGAGPLIISNIIHKTFVEVNEEGTEAAAATALAMTRSAMMMTFDKFRMVVDRPFFCAIQDNTTGALLFMGFILDPNP